jgi:hypothetical protein
LADGIMEKALRSLGGALAIFGVGVTCVGLYLVGFALFSPTQPPPSMNEGHGLAWFIGIGSAVAGLLVSTVGLAVRSGSMKRARSAERHTDPL